MNIFDKPAEQPLLNTYVPVPWEHIFKLVDYGNSKVAAADQARSGVTAALSKVPHLPIDEADVKSWQKEYFDEIAEADKETNILAKSRKMANIQSRLATDTRRVGWETRVQRYDELQKKVPNIIKETGNHDLNMAPVNTALAAANIPLYKRNEDGSVNWNETNPDAAINPDVVYTPFTDQQDVATAIAKEFADTNLGSSGWHQTYPGILESINREGVTAKRLREAFGIIDPNDYFQKDKAGNLIPKYQGVGMEQIQGALLNGIKRWEEGKAGPQYELEWKDAYSKKLPEVLEALGPNASEEDVRAASATLAMKTKVEVYEKYVDMAVSQRAHEKVNYRTHSDPDYAARAAAARELQSSPSRFTTPTPKQWTVPILTGSSGAPITDISQLGEEKKKIDARIEELEKKDTRTLGNAAVKSEYDALRFKKAQMESLTSNLEKTLADAISVKARGAISQNAQGDYYLFSNQVQINGIRIDTSPGGDFITAKTKEDLFKKLAKANLDAPSNVFGTAANEVYKRYLSPVSLHGVTINQVGKNEKDDNEVKNLVLPSLRDMVMTNYAATPAVAEQLLEASKDMKNLQFMEKYNEAGDPEFRVVLSSGVNSVDIPLPPEVYNNPAWAGVLPARKAAAYARKLPISTDPNNPTFPLVLDEGTFVNTEFGVIFRPAGVNPGDNIKIGDTVHKADNFHADSQFDLIANLFK